MVSFLRLCLFLCAFTLCAAQATSAMAAEITVSAAASLSNAFTEVKEAFMKKHPDIKVVTNFAASNPLLKQIEEGAPVDVFASADQETMNKAAEKQLIAVKSRVDFALNSLVLIAPAQGEPLKDVAFLADAKVARIAIGNPASVPAGRYAQQSFTAAGLWDTLQSKFVMGESVRQTLDYVVRGEVQAGVVYMTDAKQAGEKVRIVATLTKHDPVLYPIAVTKNSASPEAAQTFVDFVRSAEGEALLGKYGFVKP